MARETWVGIGIWAVVLGSTWYWRSWVWETIKWMLQTKLVLLVVNLIIGYLAFMLPVAVYFGLNELMAIPKRPDYFEALVYIHRNKLREEGFFDNDNAQKGKLEYPNNTADSVAMANRAFRTFMIHMAGNFFLFWLGTLFFMLPIDDYIFKSALIVPHGAMYLLLNSIPFNIMKFDLIKIVEEAPQEEPIENEPEVDIVPLLPPPPPPVRVGQELQPADLPPPPANLLDAAEVQPVNHIEIDNDLMAIGGNIDPANQPEQRRRLNEANPQPQRPRPPRARRAPGNPARRNAIIRNRRWRPTYPIDNAYKNPTIVMGYSAVFCVISLIWAVLGPRFGALILRSLFSAPPTAS